MRILFIGTGAIGVPVLRMLLDAPGHSLVAVITQPDKPAGRSQQLLASPIKELALRRHVAIFQPKRIRDAAAIEQAHFLRPDVIVVMAYGQIFPGELLRVPALAFLNLHASLLPRHRGAAPIHAAIEAGDPRTGITVMYVDEGLDTGDVLLRKEIPIRRRDTAGSLHDRLADLAPEALAEALSLLKLGRAPRIPQDASFATYSPKLGRENGRIDWSASQVRIERKIRAMNPWPAAHTLLPDKEGGAPRTLKIFSAIRSRRSSGKPGEVLRVDKHGILVAAGEGGLLLRDIQLEGRKRMSARDFLLGYSIAPGTMLGP